METAYRVGEFEIQVRGRRLLRDGELQALGARAFDLLLALIDHRDRVVSKDLLMLLVWPNVVVEENNLTVQISALRKVLGPGLIATVPGRGYRFTGEIDGDAEGTEARDPNEGTEARDPNEGTEARDPTEEAEAAAPSPPPARAATPTRLKSNLPAVLPSLIGRAADLQALEALVTPQTPVAPEAPAARRRLVTLLGAGGVGKSTLARQLLAGQLRLRPHGGCWVDLAPLADATALPATLAAALGLSLGRGEALTALADAMSPLCLLLVLDNAEHLAPGVAALLQVLLAQVPGLQVLVTSQGPLHLPQEHLFRLGPLALPAAGAQAAEAAAHGAVALFVARAQAVQRQFVLDDGNAPTVILLCRSLDGNPLAIELAAARLPLLGLARLADSLDQRLRLLRAASHGSPARQQSVLAALEWSHGLLAPREQVAFCRLAAFAGAAELGWIQAVLVDDPAADAATGLADGWAVIDALAELVDRSLVVVTADEPPRYRLLESPRALAREKLHWLGEGDRLRGRHAQAMASHAEQQMHQPDAEADTDDLRAAFAWARQHDVDSALILGARLARLAKTDTMAEQARLRQALESLLDQAQARAPAACAGRAAWARSWLGWLVCDSHPAAAAAHASAAATWFADQGDRAAHYAARCHQALALARLDAAQALQALAVLLSLQDPGWPPLWLATGAGAEAKVAFFSGDAARARAALQRQVALRKAAGKHHHGELANLVMVERAAGNVEQALTLGVSLVEQLRGSREERSLNYARLNLAGAAIQAGDIRLARRVIGDAWPAVHRFGLYRSWLHRLLEFTRRVGRERATLRLAHACLALGDEGQVPANDGDRDIFEAVVAHAQQSWPADTCERLRREGLALDSDSAFALAMAEADD